MLEPPNAHAAACANKANETDYRSAVSNCVGSMDSGSFEIPLPRISQNVAEDAAPRFGGLPMPHLQCP